VSGTVTQKGKPVEGATVSFSRGTGDLTKGELAIGKTDANGRYELMTHFGSQTASASGAVPGDYKVTISKPIPPNGMTEAQHKALVDAATKAGESGGMVAPGKQPPALVEYFPPRYSLLESTTLTGKVEKTGGEINFTLD
jgi:hypothetical protein